MGYSETIHMSDKRALILDRFRSWLQRSVTEEHQETFRVDRSQMTLAQSAFHRPTQVIFRKLKPLAIASLSLLLLARSNANAQGTRVHVEKDSTYTRTLDLIRDNQKGSIKFRSFRVQVTDPAGKTRKFIARMLYDSQTKLFYWECFELYDNYNTNSESEAQTFANVSTIYLSNDRLRIFHTTIPKPLVVSESADRYHTLGQAQNALLHFFEKKPLPDYRLEKSKAVDYLRNMPKGFLMQCMTDIDMPPRIENLKREGKLWKVAVRAQNGNRAEISLDESYNVESVNFTINPAAVSQGGCGR